MLVITVVSSIVLKGYHIMKLYVMLRKGPNNMYNVIHYIYMRSSNSLFILKQLSRMRNQCR